MLLSRMEDKSPGTRVPSVAGHAGSRTEHCLQMSEVCYSTICYAVLECRVDLGSQTHRRYIVQA